MNDLPESIIQCVDGCLALDPEERIPDCLTVLEVLAGLQEWFVSPHPIPTEAIVERMDDDVPLMQVAGTAAEDDPTAAVESGIVEGSIGADAEFESLTTKRRSTAAVAAVVGLTALILLLALAVSYQVIGSLLEPIPDAINASTKVENLPEPVVLKSTPPVPEKPSEGAVADEPSADETQEVVLKTGATEEEAVDSKPVVKAKPPVRRPARQAPKALPLKVKLLSVPPNAAVILNGKEQGRTNKKMDLKPGSYSVTLKSGAKERTFKIGVKSGASNKWCYDFTSDQVYNKSCPAP